MCPTSSSARRSPEPRSAAASCDTEGAERLHQPSRESWLFRWQQVDWSNKVSKPVSTLTWSYDKQSDQWLRSSEDLLIICTTIKKKKKKVPGFGVEVFLSQQPPQEVQQCTEMFLGGCGHCAYNGAVEEWGGRWRQAGWDEVIMSAKTGAVEREK